MAGLFSKPSVPAPPPVAPPAPTMQNTSADGDAAAMQAARAVAGGRTSTYLTGGAGLDNLGDTKKVLLGTGG